MAGAVFEIVRIGSNTGAQAARCNGRFWPTSAVRERQLPARSGNSRKDTSASSINMDVHKRGEVPSSHTYLLTNPQPADFRTVI